MSLLSSSASCLLLPGRALLRQGGRVLEETRGEGWDGALASLDALLQAARPGGLRVALSHQFAALHLVEPPPVRLRGEEMQGWLRDHLALDFGAETEGWRLAWQDAAPGQRLPVASMPVALYDALAATLTAHRVKLSRSAPWLVVAWARHRRAWGRSPGWFAALEPGYLALARVERGTLAGLSLGRVGLEAGAPPPAQVSAAVARQALHLGVAAEGPVWVLAPATRADWTRETGGQRLLPLPGTGEGWGGLLP